jgi:hypothetical protein
MKKTFWMILFVGVCWLIALAMQAEVTPHIMLDAILPPRILESTTPEERMEIAAALREHFPPSILSWIGACGICGLSVYGLWTSSRARCKADK